MKTRITSVLGVCAILAWTLVAVPSVSGCEREKSVHARAAGGQPVITVLERRGEIVTVKAGPNGPLYSARSKSGEVIARDLSAEELQAVRPDLYEFVKTSTAGEPGSFMDASVELPDRR